MANHFAIGLFVMNGVGFSNEAGDGAFTDVDRVTQALSFLGEAVAQGYVSEGTAGYTADDANLLYYSKKAAMIWSGPLNDLSTYPEMDAITKALPALKGYSAEKGQNYIWPNYIMAYSQSPHPEACLTFVEWWIKNCADLYYEGDLSSMPALYSILENEFYSGRNQAQEIFSKVLPNATIPVYPAQYLYPACSIIEGETYANPAIQSVLTGATNYEELALELQQNIQDLFDEMAE